MQLTLHADYSLRVLLYLAGHPGRAASTQEISAAYGISKNHLVRVVQTLNRHGFVTAKPGRTGGVVLERDPAAIRIGDVVRKTEPNFHVVECFDQNANTCRIVRGCSLRPVLHQAMDAFFAELDRYTLADVIAQGGRELANLLVGIEPAPATKPQRSDGGRSARRAGAV